MALSVPEKKPCLPQWILRRSRPVSPQPFALVARIPALSALEVPSQAFWSLVFGLLLLFVAYLNDRFALSVPEQKRRLRGSCVQLGGKTTCVNYQH
jgi:hypothetical protein